MKKTIKFTVELSKLKRVEKVLSRAENSKLNALSYTISDVYETTCQHDTIPHYKVTFKNVDITVTYESDYTYLGCVNKGIAHFDDNAVVNTEINVSDMRCSECGRILKNAIFVRSDKTGEVLTLGGNCADLYLGPKFYFLSDLNAACRDTLIDRPFTVGFNINVAVSWALLAIKHYGFAPTSTVNATSKFVNCALRRSQNLWENRIINGMVDKHSDDEVSAFAQKADEVIAKIRAKKVTTINETNTYEYNVYTTMCKDVVTDKDIPLICAACRDIVCNENDDGGVHVGNIGDKLQTKIKNIKTVTYSGVYGDYNVVTFTTENGETLVYKGNTDFDDVKEIKFTVKAHDTYKGKNVTRISYVRKVK